MDISFPLQFNNKGRTADANSDQHIRDMIEAVLFTSPGERVNRPDFGSGLLQLVFEPNSNEQAVATQFLVQGALQQWLGDIIIINEVLVENEDSTLQVTVSYTVPNTMQNAVVQFSR